MPKKMKVLEGTFMPIDVDFIQPEIQAQQYKQC
jgi:hypothetical protein